MTGIYIAVTATNGAASTNETVTVPVLSAIDTPSSPSFTITSVNNVTGTPSASSPDGGPVTYHVVTNPVGGSLTVDSTTGAFTYTPTAAARTIANTGVDTDVFTVTATNAVGNVSVPAVITVPISHASNNTPSGSVSQHYNNGVMTGTVTGSSPDGSPVTYSATGIPGSISVNPTTGAYTYTFAYTTIL